MVGVLKRAEMIWAFKELTDEHQRLLKRTHALPPDAGGRFSSRGARGDRITSHGHLFPLHS